MPDWTILVVVAGVLLLWCCETGREAQGEAFLTGLSRVTNTKVAASTNLVGATSRGQADEGEIHLIVIVVIIAGEEHSTLGIERHVRKGFGKNHRRSGTRRRGSGRPGGRRARWRA